MAAVHSNRNKLTPSQRKGMDQALLSKGHGVASACIAEIVPSKNGQSSLQFYPQIVVCFHRDVIVIDVLI